MSCIVEALARNTRNRRRRRSRSSSWGRSHSSSQRGRRSSSSSSALRQELHELRKFLEERKASAAAAREAEKKRAEHEQRDAKLKKLEERILRTLPTPAKSAPPQVQRGASPFPPVADRFIETLTDGHVSSDEVHSWGETVGQRLTTLDAQVLRQLLQNHGLVIPRKKPEKVAKLLEFLVGKCSL